MMVTKRFRIVALGLVLLCCATLAHAATDVHATLDRNHAALGDTLTLTVRITGTTSVWHLDLDALDKDFEVTGRSTGSSRSWINGKSSSSVTVKIGLRPRHAGTLNVPALDVDGQHTQPLTLQVSNAPTKAQGHAGDPVWMELSLSTHKPYVGEQVSVDLKLFYTTGLVDGNIRPLHAGQARIKRLGKTSRYQVHRQGRDYMVNEQHFSLIADASGHLQLDPILFRGHLLDRSGMGGFFNRGKVVSAQSKALQLDVRPRPSGSGSGPWLPARQVQLSLSGWPPNGKVQAGEPITVTVHEGATGLMAQTLPKPTLPKIPGAKVYPDRTHDATQENGQWITGSRSRSFAIVPEHSGTLSLPPITLDWWDVVNDKLRKARISAHHLQVTVAGSTGPTHAASRISGVAESATSAHASPSPAGAASSPSATISAPAVSHAHDPWRMLALVSLAIVLLMLLGLIVLTWWWRARRGAPVGQKPSLPMAASSGIRRLRHAFLAAARSGDMHAAAHALLVWAQAEQGGVRNLSDLAARITDAAQIRAVQELQRSQYATASETHASGDALAHAFKQGLTWRKATSESEDSVLPPLYPRR